MFLLDEFDLREPLLILIFSLVVLVNVFVTDIAILPNHVMAVWSVLVFLVKLKSVIRICAQLTVNGHNGLIGQNVLAHVTVVSEIVGDRAMRHSVVENSVKATRKKLPGATVSHVLPMERGQIGHSGHNAVSHVVVESKREFETVTILLQLMVVQIALVSISSEHTATKHAKNLNQSESRVSPTNQGSSKRSLFRN